MRRVKENISLIGAFSLGAKSTCSLSRLFHICLKWKEQINIRKKKFAYPSFFHIIPAVPILLGISQVVRQGTLNPPSGVRIPHSQPMEIKSQSKDGDFLFHRGNKERDSVILIKENYILYWQYIFFSINNTILYIKFINYEKASIFWYWRL